MNKNLPYFLTCAALAATWAFAGYAGRSPTRPLARPLSAFPKEIAGWTGVDDPPQAPKILALLGTSTVISRTYSRMGREINLFVAYYARQQESEIMHSPKRCLPGGGWEPLESSIETVLTPRGRVSINRYVLQMSGAKILVLYWYQSPERVIANEYAGKAYLFWDALIHRRGGGSIVRLTLPATPEALKEGLTLAPLVIAEVQKCLGG